MVLARRGAGFFEETYQNKWSKNSHTTAASHGYEAQIFSHDPLVIYLKDFLSTEEVNHLLRIRQVLSSHPQSSLLNDMQNSDGRYEPSRVYHGDSAIENKKARLSESARVDRDDVVRGVEKRARRFQGWRGNSTKLQPPMTQRYTEGGFFDYHYDFDELVEKGNRVTTFMMYLADNAPGEGQAFRA